ncbi:MAG TPA: RDD family protein [Nautiliaceae bacterium]|nr:RDD family protein [Nautiliaceae bacterium]
MEEIINRLDREGLKVASISKRIVAMGIDDFLISFLVVIAFIDKFQVAKSYEEILLLTNSLFIYIFMAYTLYHWIFISLYGKTIGKMVVKIRVVDINSLDNPNFLNSFIRSLVRNFSEMFFYFGMLYAFVDPLNRALHDIVGKCVVIEE